MVSRERCWTPPAPPTRISCALSRWQVWVQADRELFTRGRAAAATPPVARAASTAQPSKQDSKRGLAPNTCTPARCPLYCRSHGGGRGSRHRLPAHRRHCVCAPAVLRCLAGRHCVDHLHRRWVAPAGGVGSGTGCRAHAATIFLQAFMQHLSAGVMHLSAMVPCPCPPWPHPNPTHSHPSHLTPTPPTHHAAAAGILMFKNLPRQTFGRLQSKLFPA